MRKTKISKISGFSLAELIIGFTIGTLLIGAAVYGISMMLRSNAANQKFQIAAGLNQEMIEKVRAVAGADWNELYIRNKGESAEYHIDISGQQLEIVGGRVDNLIEGVTYSSYFFIENVCRDDGGVITGVTDNNGGDYSCNSTQENDSEDPSTQKITVFTKWPSGTGGISEVKLIDYVTRWQNAVFHQTDWAGGGGFAGPLTAPDDRFANSANIDFSSSGLIKLQGF